MKNLVYISGILGISFSILGITFKVLHWPGAGISIFVGLICLSLIFVPLALIKLNKSTKDKLLKAVYWLAAVSFMITIIGMLFKIQHWPGASILLVIGVPLPFIILLPTYLFYHQKRKLKSDHNFFAVILFFLFLGIFSTLLAVNVSKNVLNMFANLSDEQAQINTFLSASKETPDHKIKKTLSLIKQMKEKAVKESKGNLSHKNYVVFQSNSNEASIGMEFYKNLLELESINKDSEQVVKNIAGLMQKKKDIKYLSVHHALFMNIMNNWESQLLVLQKSIQ